MFYERKIKYLDYFESGVRVRGGGFIKLEARDGSLRIELTVTGLHQTDTYAREVMLCGRGREKSVGRIEIAAGKGQYRQQWRSLENIGGTGIGYGELLGIRIPLGPGREISGRWQEAGAETGSRPGRRQETGAETDVRPGRWQETGAESGARPERDQETGDRMEAGRRMNGSQDMERRQVSLDSESLYPGYAVEQDRSLEMAKMQKGGNGYDKAPAGGGKPVETGLESNRHAGERPESVGDESVGENLRNGYAGKRTNGRETVGSPARERAQERAEESNHTGTQTDRNGQAEAEIVRGIFAAGKAGRNRLTNDKASGKQRAEESAGGRMRSSAGTVWNRTNDYEATSIGIGIAGESPAGTDSAIASSDRGTPGRGPVQWKEPEGAYKADFSGNAQPSRRRRAAEQEKEPVRLMEDKWPQLWALYPHIRPFQDEREYLSIGPSDFVLFPEDSYRAVNNSFLLHGYYNYLHLILGRMERKGEYCYYIGVPGNFYEREKQVAVMFGFESFECAEEPAQPGDFGYYMMRTRI